MKKNSTNKPQQIDKARKRLRGLWRGRIRTLVSQKLRQNVGCLFPPGRENISTRESSSNSRRRFTVWSVKPEKSHKMR